MTSDLRDAERHSGYARLSMAFDEQLAEDLRMFAANEHGISERRMFGGIGFLINGNLAVSASAEGGLLLRVDPEEAAELILRPRARRCIMRGKEMRGWIRVDVDSDAEQSMIEAWARIGFAYARSLPPK